MPPDEIEDRLIERIRDGDRLALQELLLRNYDWLQRYLVGMIPSNQRNCIAIDDLMQEVYLRIFRSIDRFRVEGRSQLFSWLQTIGRNTLFDESRKQARSARVIQNPSLNDTAADSIDSLISQIVPDDDARVTHLIQANELKHAFWIAMGSLPEDYSRVLRMLYIDGISIDEAANRLEKSVGAVRGMRTRARERLKEEIVRLSNYVDV